MSIKAIHSWIPKKSQKTTQISWDEPFNEYHTFAWRNYCTVYIHMYS
jgi:hypothetical protein